MAVGTTNYPAALDDATSLIRAVNLASSTIDTGGVTDVATTVPVVSAANAAADGVAWCGTEAISYTGKTGTSLTGCVRGFNGTTAASHAAGDPIYFDPAIAARFTVLQNSIIALETALGITNGLMAPRILRDRGGQVFNVKAYGAAGDGSADDTAEIQAALDDAAAVGGGVVFLPKGNYKVSATLTITGKAVSIVGVGTGDANLDSVSTLAAADYGSLITWAGGASPVISAVQMEGAFWHSFAIDGIATATYGIQLDRVRRSEFANLRLIKSATCDLRLWIGAASGSDDNTMLNHFSNIQLERSPKGLIFEGNAFGNCCHNTFSNLHIDHTAAYGLDLVEADNNFFANVMCYPRFGAGYSEYSVRFGAKAYGNVFVSLQGRLYAVTTTITNGSNSVFHYDAHNGEGAPTIEAGASVDWTSTGANSVGWRISSPSPELILATTGDTGRLRIFSTGSANYLQTGLSGTSGSDAPLIITDMLASSEYGRFSTAGLTLPALAGGGTRLVLADNSGVVGPVTLGAGLSFAGTTLSGVGGAAGSNTQLQYNNGGVMAGAVNLTYDGTAQNISDGSSVYRFLCSGGVNYIQSGLTLTGGSSAPLSIGSIFGAAEWLNVASTAITASVALVAAAGTTTLAPLRIPAGTLLTTPVAGVMEYSTEGFFFTSNTTNGRADDNSQQVRKLTANSGNIGATIADYFAANSGIPTVAGANYEIRWYLHFTKNTAGTVTFTITSSTAPTRVKARYIMTPVGGIGTVGTPQTAGIHSTTSTTAVLPATGSLTNGTDHYAEIRCNFVANTAGNVRLRATESAGTITPLADSYFTVRRIPADTGTFVA